MKNSPDMYDTIYTEWPDRWGNDGGRDEYVFENLIQPASVLDIGCGNGHTLAYLSEKWPETKLYGVDISPVAISLAMDKVPFGSFFIGTVDDVDVKVDIAILLGVAEHFEDLDELGRVKKVLNERGLVYLEVPNCISYRPGKEDFRGGIQDEWHFYKETWERKIKEQGYNILKSIVGKKATWEFIWILENGRHNT